MSLDSGRLSRSIFFSWFTPILQTGNEKSLQLPDLLNLPSELFTKTNVENFLSFTKNNPEKFVRQGLSWKKYVFDEVASIFPLLKVILSRHALQLIKITSLKIIICSLNFVGPLLLGQIVSFLEKDQMQNHFAEGLLLVFYLALNNLVSSIVNTNINARNMEINIQVQLSLTSIVYQRALSLPLSAWQDLNLTDSQINNFLQVDVEQISSCLQNINDLWLLPIQIFVAFFFLYEEVKLAFLAGIAVIIIVIPINSWITHKIGKSTKELMKHKDTRIQYLSEGLKSFPVVKMLGLEYLIPLRSKESRSQEFHYLSIRKYLDAVCVFLWAATPNLVFYVTFVLAVLIRQKLTAAKVVTSMALLHMLIFPMNALPWILNGYMEARVSLQRISKLLNDSSGLFLDTYFIRQMDSKAQNYLHLPHPHHSQSHHQPTEHSHILSITRSDWVVRSSKSSSFSKDKGSEANSVESFVVSLRSNIQFHVGELWGIVGRVGAGKSLLLLALLGELSTTIEAQHVDQESESRDDIEMVTHNTTSLSSLSLFMKGNTTYCAQIPSLFSGTIRQNIIMHEEFNADRYWRIIRGCGLDKDFEAKSMKQGDQTEIGDQGVGLSGGQRLRVGIARCFYSSSNFILLDDPFSALDLNTANILYDYIMNVVIRVESRCVIMTTHSLDRLKQAKKIIFLEKGLEIARDNYERLYNQSEEFRLLISEQAKQQHKLIDKPHSEETISPEVHFHECDLSDAKHADIQTSDNANLSDGAEDVTNKFIEWQVYVKYFESMKYFNVISTLFSLFFMQVTGLSLTFWFGYWATHQTEFSSITFIYITSLLVVFHIISTTFRAITFTYTNLIACQVLYQKLIDSIFHISLQYFEKHLHIGQLLNRIGKDMNTIDDSLPFIANICLAQFFNLLASFCLIAINDPLMIILFIIIFWIYFKLNKFYRASLYDLKRIDMKTRSPIYLLASETLMGHVTIHSFSQKAIEYFIHKMDNCLQIHAIGSFNVLSSYQWFAIRLQLLGVVITTALALSLILNSLYDIIHIPPGFAGLSLIYANTLVANLNNFMNSFSETEQELISVERILQYSTFPNEFNSEELSQEQDELISWSRRESDYLLKSRNEPVKARKPLLFRVKNVWDTFRKRYSLLSNVLISSYPQHRYQRVSVNDDLSLDDFRYDMNEEDHNPLIEDESLTTTHPLISSLPKISFFSKANTFNSSSFKLQGDFGGIKLFSVSMSYESAGESDRISYALKDLSLSIPPGSRVLITGRTGSGKSSLFRCLLRLNDYAGSITLNGKELKDISRRFLRQNIILITQHPFLMTGTIRMNLDPRYEYTDDQILDFLQELRLLNLFENQFSSLLSSTSSSSSMIPTSETFLHYKLDSQGGNLSIGQQQLISLGRALLRRSDFILIDEITASLDVESMSIVKDALLRYYDFVPSAILLMISHRFENLQNLCNMELKLSEGKILSFEKIH